MIDGPRNLHDSLGAAAPPAAEGGRPGGDGSGPLAAPRRDVPDGQAAAMRRWYDALFAITRDGCAYFTTARCWQDPCRSRAQWCPACIASDALNPSTSSPQPDPLRSEAARPEPSRDGDLGGPGRATNFP